MQLVDSGSSRTDWSLIVDVTQADEQAAAEALERLVRRYWAPVYAYIRGTGRDIHAAADLTQGFVCDVIISRRLCDFADPTRGRFRSLLLTAVKNYLREQHRHNTRKRRSGSWAGLPAPTSADWAEAADPSSSLTPEEAFSRQWSTTLVRQVLATVREGCMTDGLEPHWTVFEHRVVRPMMMGDPPTDYAILLEQLKLKDQSQAANMMITVKRRFVRALYDEVGQTVSNPQQTEEEICELLRDLERPR